MFSFKELTKEELERTKRVNYNATIMQPILYKLHSLLTSKYKIKRFDTIDIQNYLAYNGWAIREKGFLPASNKYHELGYKRYAALIVAPYKDNELEFDNEKISRIEWLAGRARGVLRILPPEDLNRPEKKKMALFIPVYTVRGGFLKREEIRIYDTIRAQILDVPISTLGGQGITLESHREIKVMVPIDSIENENMRNFFNELCAELFQ